MIIILYLPVRVYRLYQSVSCSIAISKTKFAVYIMTENIIERMISLACDVCYSRLLKNTTSK